jgi:hypothetical protein
VPLLLALVAARIALPLVLLHPAWELHRDELLYFAMGDHLAWRMQFPPLVPVVAALGQSAFGDAVWSARVPAALAGGLLTGSVLWLVRRLGGGAAALGFAWLAMLAAPVFVRSSVLMHPVVFDQAWATLAVAGAMLAAHERQPRWWLLTGAALGLGLLTKASAVLYALLLAASALAHGRLRSQLSTRWPWIAAALAVALGLPALLGQLAWGWPVFKSLDALARTQLVHVQASETVRDQAMLLAAGMVPVLAGLWVAWRGDATLRPAARVATVFAGGLLLIVLVRSGKAYYVAPAWPAVIAVGAVALARVRHPQLRWPLAAAMTASAALLLPMGVPLLAPDPMARYAARLGVGTTTNRGTTRALPQDYADMLGWRRMTDAVVRVWLALPPEDRAVAITAASNYGEAGALAVYGRRHGLPYPVSVHGDFHAWGLGGRAGDVVIHLGQREGRARLEALFRQVDAVAGTGDPRAVDEERDLMVHVARGPRRPLAVVWPTLGPRWD